MQSLRDSWGTNVKNYTTTISISVFKYQTPVWFLYIVPTLIWIRHIVLLCLELNGQFGVF